MNKNKSKILVVVGQTASGKSSLSIKLAKALNAEIIAADSRTIYKSMDVGTAKPSKEDQDLVVHHCIDLVFPDEDFNVVKFNQHAKAAIEDIQARDKQVIIVGGTGLYVDSLLFNYAFKEMKGQETRSELVNESIDDLNLKARKLGYISKDEVVKNRRHIVRIIERGGRFEERPVMDDRYIVVGINPARSVLRLRIEERAEQMFKAGLKKEYLELIDRYGSDCESMTGIGYREFAAWSTGAISVGQVKRDIIKNTLKLAKRQRTWFKRNQNINWFEDSNSAYSWALSQFDGHMVESTNE